MTTILTDDEIQAAIREVADLSPVHAGRAVIAAYEAKLAQQEPVAGVVLTPAWGGKTRPALVDEGDEQWHCANRGAARLYTQPAPQQSEKQCQHGAWIDCGICDKPHTHPASQQADRQRVPAGWASEAVSLLKRLGPKPWATSPEAWAQARLISDFEDAAMLAAAPEAPAQAGAVDERAAFEAWVTELGVAMHYEGDGHYGNATVARWWEAWQARAALTQKGGST